MAEFVSSPLNTPIHYLQEFSRRGDLDGVQEVITEHPELKDELAPAGLNALHSAASAGHIDVVDFLISANVDVNAKSNRGDTALHFAAHRGLVDVILKLVEAGADADIANNAGETPSDIASNNDVQMALRGVNPHASNSILMAEADEDSD